MKELRAIMTVIIGLCALSVASSVIPVVDHITSVLFGVLFGLGGLVVSGCIALEVWRELRFRAEMRALDRRDASRQAAAYQHRGRLELGTPPR